MLPRLATWVYKGLLARLLLVLIAGCVSVKFEGAESPLELTPEQVIAAGGDPSAKVVWGGRIVAIENLPDGTEIEVLAVPLTGGNVPKLNHGTQGRFVAFYPGFLEPLDYAPGRFVSLAGQLDGLVDGWVGEQPMQFPMVQTSQVHLWPADTSRWNTQWRF